jgi:tagatose 1,6-diphosphate aldolase GatY/KbaY
VDAVNSKMTDPVLAMQFVSETNVDMLAVTIGNVHGKYKTVPKLDLERLSTIRRNISSDIPLVLHGASGLTEQWIGGCILRGVSKFNVNTELRQAVLASVVESANTHQVIIEMYCCCKIVYTYP